MKRILALVLCAGLVVSFVGCSSSTAEISGNSEASTMTTEDVTSTEPQVTETPKENVDSTSKDETAVVYADDEVVNEFIIAYNKISDNDFIDISKGNIRTKYHAYSYGYYCELLNSNATNKISISISETNDNADIGIAGMRDIFRDIAVTIDSTLSDDTIYGCFDQLVNDNFFKEDIILGAMTILYCPDKDLGSGHSRGHIEIKAQ